MISTALAPAADTLTSVRSPGDADPWYRAWLHWLREALARVVNGAIVAWVSLAILAHGIPDAQGVVPSTACAHIRAHTVAYARHTVDAIRVGEARLNTRRRFVTIVAHAR